MPWKVSKRGKKYVVVVSDGPKKGKVVGTHDSAEEAEKHKRALYANAHLSNSAVNRLTVKLAATTIKPHTRKVNGKMVKVKGHKRSLLNAVTHEAHTGRQDLTTLFGQQSVARAGEDAALKHLRIAKERERYKAKLKKDRLAQIEQAVDKYRSAIGLPHPKADWDSVICDMEKGERVAQAFLAAKSDPNDKQVRAAYRALVAETKAQFDMVTRPESEGGLGVTVEFVDEAEPYKSAEDQAKDVIDNKRLRIATISIWPDSYHPLLSNERGGEYDMFRAVHDIFGHVAIGGGFDRHGEYAAWLHHTSMYTGQAQKAASTELHGENSVLWTTGKAPEHKAIVLPPELIARPFDPKTGEWVRMSQARNEWVGEGKYHYDGIRELVERYRQGNAA